MPHQPRAASVRLSLACAASPVRSVVTAKDYLAVIMGTAHPPLLSIVPFLGMDRRASISVAPLAGMTRTLASPFVRVQIQI